MVSSVVNISVKPMLFYEVRVFKKSTGKHEIKKAASSRILLF